jgi:hypothetical protein
MVARIERDYKGVTGGKHLSLIQRRALQLIQRATKSNKLSTRSMVTVISILHSTCKH